ncbi:MAG: hypothetical protein ABJV04_15940 [Aliiglaciecola sp.]|uniref:hypothetical protein n=1 Tax=Aliiglaciecola sp. TaxID=1872441 RepID=UPI003297A795
MKKIILAALVAFTSSFANATLVPVLDLDFGTQNLESEITSTGTLSFTDPIGSDGETFIYA